MMKQTILGIAVVLPISGCKSINEAAIKTAEGLQGAMQNAHNFANSLQSTNSVRGRVRLRDGQTLTCFDGIPGGYIGSQDMTSPADASYDSLTGKLPVKTAAIPVVVMTEAGTVIAINLPPKAC